MGEYEERYPESYGREEPATAQDSATGSPPRRPERFSLRSWFGGAAAAPAPTSGPIASDMPSAEPGWHHEPREAAALRYSAGLAQAGAGRFRGIGPRNYVRSPQRIYEDICDRLTDDPLIDASDIEVAISGGEVTLAGSVDDAMAANRVEAIAREVPGLKNIRNNLRVRRQPATQTLAQRVARPQPVDAG